MNLKLRKKFNVNKKNELICNKSQSLSVLETCLTEKCFENVTIDGL